MNVMAEIQSHVLRDLEECMSRLARARSRCRFMFMRVISVAALYALALVVSSESMACTIAALSLLPQYV